MRGQSTDHGVDHLLSRISGHFGRPGRAGGGNDGRAGVVGLPVADGIGGSPDGVLDVVGVGPETGVTGAGGVTAGPLPSGFDGDTLGDLGAGGLIGVGESGTVTPGPGTAGPLLGVVAPFGVSLAGGVGTTPSGTLFGARPGGTMLPGGGIMPGGTMP